MAIVCTSLGKTTNDGLTAVVNSIATVNGRLYLVAGSGTSKGAGAWYDSLIATTTGPTPTLAKLQRASQNSMTPIASIYQFTGDGATINVTVTQGTPTGSPTVPLTGCCVIEVTGCSGVTANTNSADVDAPSGPWDFDLVIGGTPAANNHVFGVIVVSAFTSLMTVTPRYTETQVDTGNDVEASGNGYGGSAGSNMTWQAELSVANTLTVGWHGDVDDYRQSQIAVELTGVPSVVTSLWSTGRRRI